MKTLLIFLFAITLNSYASTKWGETEKHERLNNRIESRAGNISFLLEMDFPNEDDAWYIAYKKCGDSYPIGPSAGSRDFDEYTEYALEVKGYEVIYHYGHGIKMPYYYKCKDENGHQRTAKTP